MAAVSFPMSRTVGRPGDREGQLAVLRALLKTLQEIETPGGAAHLPFEWPETPKEAAAHRQEAPPIAQYLKKNPWDMPRLNNRSLP